MICAVSLFAANSAGAATTINFTLDEPCKTSAGVYQADGTLVRTLWSNVRYFKAGTYSETWDGNDDTGTPVAAGNYTVKVLQHNVQYVWDGFIGNSSADLIGTSVHRGFASIQDMSSAGTKVFYCSGYAEGKMAFRVFFTNDVQHLANTWFWDINQFGAMVSQPGVANRFWKWTAADETNVYFACDSTYNTNTGDVFGSIGVIVASKVSNQSLASFTSGTVITNGPTDSFPNGICVGTQPGLSGLAVQVNGNLLAAAVAPDNKIYLFDKTSGATLGSINLNYPGRMNFATNGNLWVTASNAVICYNNLSGTPAVARMITNGLVMPLAVAASPVNPNLILVADGGSSQQIKAFDTNGVFLWTYGLAGGYQTSGPAVQTNKFWFSCDGVVQTFLSFMPDGSFWVGDGENHRSLHYSLNPTPAYVEQIMYQPRSYTVSVDKNNPSRVFNQFLEFNVDYTKSLSNAWTLVNNWKANVDLNHITFDEGPIQITTFTNGRTYALITNLKATTDYLKELCELTTNGIRFTGIFPMTNAVKRRNSLGADGSARAAVTDDAKFYQATLSGFDASNNPTWNTETLIASASKGSTDPVNRNGASARFSTTISSGNVLVSFDSTLNKGFHLGGIKVGGTNWLWRASPVGTLNDDGHYEIASMSYAGSDVQTLGRSIVYGFHGEFFRGQSQAGQYLHFYDDGLFVGEYGESLLGYCVYNGALPGFAANGFGPNLIQTTNGEYYAWDNDENGESIQRWHLVNVNAIREASGSGPLNGNIAVTNQSYPFPTAVTGVPGNQGGQIRWNPVAGAGNYNVRYSTLNGGPYLALAGTTAGTSYNVSGLTNGLTYYFAVTATVAGVESAASEQVQINPFDTAKFVIAAGSLLDANAITLTVNNLSANVQSNLPAVQGTYRNVGVRDYQKMGNQGMGSLLNPQIGSRGYIIYDFNGINTVASNLASGYVITNSAWSERSGCLRVMAIDGTVGSQNPNNYVLYADPSASRSGYIYVRPPDTNYHFLTVVSPSIYTGARKFTMTLTSTNGDAAAHSVNESVGASHTFQWLFKGNATLQVDATGGSCGSVKAIYLDDLSLIQNDPSLEPPTGLRVLSPLPTP